MMETSTPEEVVSEPGTVRAGCTEIGGKSFRSRPPNAGESLPVDWAGVVAR